MKNVDSWIAQGKQVGASISWREDDQVYWSSVGVQSWSGKVLVSVDEIPESKMAAEEYTRDELVAFETVEDARAYVNDTTRVAFDERRPCRGQRLFNPELWVPAEDG